ncbi:MAG: cold shock domain-containing protein [Holosporales bacterium]|jgi:CspA family cold shock protein|nr:cold shock domain-containing protein [Holosporales bacterium]
MSDYSSADISKKVSKLENEEAILKWFSPYRGYGFVEHPKIPEDIFVHFSVINKSGCRCLEPGDKLLCDIVQKSNGYQVTEIYKIDHVSSDNAKTPTEVLEGVVKWYNPAKGFGFAWSEDKKEDVFIHSSIIKRLGIYNLAPDCKIIMNVQRSHNGFEALDITLTG